ncbi:MAG: autotransporter assembly complex family protein [Paracoccaceae bacterium]|nr:autotransporter assembly complex family protein [Paracoccaceae bacterium]
MAVAAACLSLPALAFEATLQGVADEDLREALEGGSLLIEQAAAETEVSSQELVAIAQADYKRVLAVLYDFGYYGAIIGITLDGREASSITSVAPPRSVTSAQISVTLGKVFRFGTADIGPVAEGTVLPEGFRSGETARLSLLRDTVSAGTKAWRDQGHAKAKLESQTITARHTDGTLNATLRLDPGAKLRFGDLKVSGDSAVRTERILEIAGLPVGTVYSPDELADAAGRLRRTGAFSSVAMIEAEEVGPGDQLGITARVADDKPRRFGFGGEVSTIEGLSASAFWVHRNLFGGAERLRLEAEISGVGGETGGTDFLLGARYQRPSTFNEDTDLYILGEVEQEDEVNYFSRQATIGAGIERIVSDQRSYRFGVAVRRANTRDAFGEDQYTLLLFPTGATFDYRDKILDARKGFYLDAEVSPFYAVDGADNGVLTELDARVYRTFGTVSTTTLALRGQLGSVVGPSLEDAPADFLFYSGGGDTVRGHDYQSLGVDIGNGQIVGGRSFLGLSAEVRYRTAGSLGYVGFFDAGYIGSEALPDGSGEWQSGAGLGLRYDTPIGPIRFDVAVPTSGDDDGSSWQVYIGIGQAF